jgi:hypothetical protein
MMKSPENPAQGTLPLFRPAVRVRTSVNSGNSVRGGKDFSVNTKPADAKPAGAKTVDAKAVNAKPVNKKPVTNQHLAAAIALSRRMRKYPDHSREQTLAGRAICHHLRALLRETEARRQPH